MTNNYRSAEEIRTSLREAVDYLRSMGVGEPEVGVILGSGLNTYGEEIERRREAGSSDPVSIAYRDIPGFRDVSVSGHNGRLIYAEISGRKVVLLAGRYHFYEGHSMEDVVFPARVLIALGIKRLIITNASGAINESFKAGSLMAISDHINLMGTNPLIGPNLEELGPRFPDMTNVYTRDLRAKLIEEAKGIGIALSEGVYAGLTGPSFETSAEIRFLRTIGADCVGMSSVPEAIVASHAGLEVIGISFLSNMAAGITGNAITSDEVNEAGEKITDTFARVVDLAINL